LNGTFYGPGFTQEAALNGTGGKVEEASELRQVLSEAVKAAWAE
jgi:hypothetical protein